MTEAEIELLEICVSALIAILPITISLAVRIARGGKKKEKKVEAKNADQTRIEG